MSDFCNQCRCASCDAEQIRRENAWLAGEPTVDEWIDWPTHAGWWWVWHEDTGDPYVMVIDAEDVGSEFWRNMSAAGSRFLDARLTPPTPPKGGA